MTDKMNDIVSLKYMLDTYEGLVLYGSREEILSCQDAIIRYFIDSRTKYIRMALGLKDDNLD